MRKQIIDEKAMLADRKYEDDKPWSCKYCYFWEGRNKGCGLDECYYLIPEDGAVKTSKPAMVGNCTRCPYGKHSPCIGYCIAKLYHEMKEQRKQREGDANGK